MRLKDGILKQKAETYGEVFPNWTKDQVCHRKPIQGAATRIRARNLTQGGKEGPQGCFGASLPMQAQSARAWGQEGDSALAAWGPSRLCPHLSEQLLGFVDHRTILPPPKLQRKGHPEPTGKATRVSPRRLPDGARGQGHHASQISSRGMSLCLRMADGRAGMGSPDL